MFALAEPTTTYDPILDRNLEFGLDIDDAQPNAWHALARCATGTGTMLELFFSDTIDDINRAKAFCLGCEVRDDCLEAAIDRGEPWGVWGGELFCNGNVLAEKRRRGRPPKVRPAESAVILDPFEGIFAVEVAKTA